MTTHERTAAMLPPEGADRIQVGRVRLASSDLLLRLNVLLHQLSSSAAPLTMTALQRLIDADGSVLFAATCDGEIVGTICLALSHCPSGTRAFIEDLVVEQARRRIGVADALARAALEHARQQGARSIDLTCRPERLAANRLDQKLGFKVRSTNFYRLDC